jgi:DNA-binding CsgD family transcriptional regulator
MVALRRGRLDEARALSRRALGLADGQPLMSHLAVLATAQAWGGDPAGAVELFRQAEAAADAREILEPGLREWRPELVEALVLAGEPGEAARLLEDWEDAARRLDRKGLIAAATRCRGLIAAAMGDLGVAETLLATAAETGDPAGKLNAARAQLSLGIVRRRARKKREAREALTSARSTFEAIGAVSWEQVAVAELGRIGGGVRVEGLTASEARVAALVAEGRTNREIASALFLGERTVASHLTHIYAKLGIRSRTELTRQLIMNTDLATDVPGTFPTF